MKAVLLSAVLATPAAAESLCGRTASQAVLAQLAGNWTGEARMSVVNEVIDELRRTPADEGTPTVIAADGTLLALQDLLAEGDRPLVLAPTRPLDVDTVDDLLDAADAADFADALSDMPCGPEALPQFAAPVAVTDEAGGVSITGRIMLVPYFTDRVLRLDRLTASDGETVLYVIRALLLTPLAN